MLGAHRPQGLREPVTQHQSTVVGYVPSGRLLNTARLLITNARHIECPDSALNDEAQQHLSPIHRQRSGQIAQCSAPQTSRTPPGRSWWPGTGANREVCTASEEPLEGLRSVTPGQAPTALRRLPRRCSQQRRDHRLSRRRPYPGNCRRVVVPALPGARLRGRNDAADLYSILDLCPSNGGMEPASNRNYRTSVADAVEPATCHKSAIHTETA
jgi:hypothetical protein